jgi:hypothetical protein
VARRRRVHAVQLGERSERREDRERAGGVKAAPVMSVGDAESDLAADLDAQHVGFDQLGSAHAAAVEAREQRRQDHHARMRRHQREHVVVVERVPEGRVGERGGFG